MFLRRLLPDAFTLTLLAVVLIATLLPASGQVAVVFEWITNLAIALLFFLYGARMSPAAIGPVKAMLCELPVDALQARLAVVLESDAGTGDVRGMLTGFAAEHGIPL